MENDNCYQIGTVVSCTTTFSQTVDGEVVAYDKDSQLLIISILCLYSIWLLWAYCCRQFTCLIKYVWYTTCIIELSYKVMLGWDALVPRNFLSHNEERAPESPKFAISVNIEWLACRVPTAVLKLSSSAFHLASLVGWLLVKFHWKTFHARWHSRTRVLFCK